MKRKIKFRGKSTDTGKWVYGYLSFFYTAGRNKDGFILTDKAQMYSPEDCRSYDVWAETVGQFTGLYDKDGKEIYEGDILRIFRTDTKESLVVEVHDKGVVNVPTDEYDCMLLDLFDTCYEFQVIGNIYDNYELLEMKDYEE